MLFFWFLMTCTVPFVLIGLADACFGVREEGLLLDCSPAAVTTPRNDLGSFARFASGDSFVFLQEDHSY